MRSRREKRGDADLPAGGDLELWEEVFRRGGLVSKRDQERLKAIYAATPLFSLLLKHATRRARIREDQGNCDF